MHCVCYVCGIQYRIKPPIDDDSVSHGLCEACFSVEIRKIRKEMVALKREKYVVSPIPK